MTVRSYTLNPIGNIVGRAEFEKAAVSMTENTALRYYYRNSARCRTYPVRANILVQGWKPDGESRVGRNSKSGVSET